MDIVIATKNKKKVEEFLRILKDLNVKIFDTSDFPNCPEVEEDQDSFEGNAVKKALTVARLTNKIAIADDSGLEVFALKGEPGVRSARYAGENATDEDNLNKLLEKMKDIPDKDRGARFVCSIAIAFPDSKVKTFSGYVEGWIGKEPKGKRGFGYDPIFYPSGYNSTFAEMSPEEKDALSHRGKALEELKEYLKSLINESHK
jgi:XTP/dITP diphosphohydrolase